MKMEEHWKRGGKGVMATAGADGTVNTAVYAVPHRAGENTLAWAMTDGRTYRNIRENPNASYLYMGPGEGYAGGRITLRLKEIRESGTILDAIRSRTKESSGVTAADALRYLAFFEVVEERPLA